MDAVNGKLRLLLPAVQCQSLVHVDEAAAMLFRQNLHTAAAFPDVRYRAVFQHAPAAGVLVRAGQILIGRIEGHAEDLRLRRLPAEISEDFAVVGCQMIHPGVSVDAVCHIVRADVEKKAGGVLPNQSHGVNGGEEVVCGCAADPAVVDGLLNTGRGRDLDDRELLHQRGAGENDGALSGILIQNFKILPFDVLLPAHAVVHTPADLLGQLTAFLTVHPFL